ncbi:GNAT family N-acetyltransferase [Fictibacillus sp. FJAT-27399]|uniref:GNAT family N-acetyltransferase n=1 Tax=Fictibacillus sp. FJAT-27399 TaxID=1729689 RepID=UPI0007819986|nr:GNAT family N-acetyltransferase [Fictibacillus sp. FJAT-27399]
MIYELPLKRYDKVRKLIKEQNDHPVIQGVISGINRGKIFVDDVESPSTALIWAVNEMFYLGGDHTNHTFNSFLQPFIIERIKPDALELGENDFNLEVYPPQGWQEVISSLFPAGLKIGERVPFKFNREHFLSSKLNNAIPEEYIVSRITQDFLLKDPLQTINKEIKKFWVSEESFLEHGLGWCAMHKSKVIGTCISVLACGGDVEIGINVYETEHRGRGLATRMARGFINDCLKSGRKPHWTTETFRHDSIAIAEKLGFERLPNYQVYFLPFHEFK